MASPAQAGNQNQKSPMNILQLIHSHTARTFQRRDNHRPTRNDSAQFRGHTIPAKTGPLGLLAARDLVVIADAENLSYSAPNAGFKMSYASLGSALVKTCASLRLHACFSREAHQAGWERYFEERGWMPHARDIEYAQTRHGIQKHANADALIAFHSGRLAAETDADVLIASGDGALASDVAHSIAESWPDRLVFTLGFPGAVSSRLNAANNNGIAGNLLLGMDCLRPANGNRQ